MKKFYPTNFRKIFFLRFCILIASFLIISVAAMAQGPGASWQYFRSFTFSTPTTLNYYQVKVTLNAGQYTHMNADGSDLRFYDNSNTLCSYWIETFDNTGKSVIWVKVPTAGSNLLMYYGNAAATSLSNGANTFDFFDDFNTALGPNWVKTTVGGTITQSGTEVTLLTTVSNTVMISSPFTTASPSFFLETKHKEGAYHRNRFYAGTVINGTQPTTFDYGFFNPETDARPTGQIFWNGWQPTPLIANTDYLTQWQITDGSTYNWNNFDYATNNLIDARTATVANPIRFITYKLNEASGTSTIVDWVRVRKSQTTDPILTIKAENPNVAGSWIGIIDTDWFKSGNWVGGVPTSSINAIIPVVGSVPFQPTINAANAVCRDLTIKGAVTISGTNTLDIYGNWVNNGSFIPASSQVNLYGAALQTIGGTSNTTFYNLKIGNTAGINLLRNTSLNGNLDLTTGLVNTGIYVISVAGNAVNYSNSSYVNGKLSETFTTVGSKIFPIGKDGQYHPVTFNYTLLSGTSNVTIEQFESGLTGIFPGGVASQLRHFDISQSGGTNFNYFVTLDPNGFTTGASPQILKTEAGVNSINAATTPNFTNSTTYTTFNNTNNGTNSFALGGACISSVNAGPDMQSCQETPSAPLGGIISGGSTGVTWISSVGGTFLPNASTLNATWTPPVGFIGASVLTLTSSGACGSESDTKIVNVNALPTGATLTASVYSICAGGTVVYTASAGFTKYEFIKNSTSLQSGTSNTFNAAGLLPGDIVTVIVSNSNGCTKTLSTAQPVIINPYPSGTFSASEGSGVSANDNIICQGDEVSFSFATGYSNYKFLVNGVLPAAQDGSSPFFNTSALNNGTNNVTLEVSGAGGCNKTFGPITITVTPLPIATLTANETSGTYDDNKICFGSNVKFTATAGFSNYDFLVNGASVQNSNANILNTMSLINGDEVSVIVSNANKCSLTTAGIIITVFDLPSTPTITVDGGGSTKFCIGRSVSLTSSVATTYQWYNGVTAIVGATSQTYIATTAGDYTVSITDGNSCGATSAATTVIVDPLPATPAIGASGLTEFCEGGSVTLTITSSVTGIKGYQWNESGNPIAGEINQSYIATTAGDYTVTVTNTNGCINTSAIKPVIVNPLPATPTITAGGVTTFCDGLNVTLTSSISSTYQWYKDGSKIIGATSGNYIVTTSGDYTVEVGDAKHCKATSLALTVTVNPLPEPTLNGPNPICPGSTGTYTTEPGFTNYSWTFTGGTLNTGGGVNDNSITIDWDVAPGSKTVFVNYENSFGCSASESKTVTTSVNPLPKITASQTDNVCIDYPGNVYSTETTAGITGYIWTIAGGTINSGQGTSSVSVTWTTAGVQSISVNYTNGAGCTAVSPTKHNVTVHPLPIAKFSYANGSYCANDFDPLPAMGTGAVKGTFSSTTGLIFISTTTGMVDLSASTAGTYTVTNTVAAANGCNAVSETAEITINGVPSGEISYAGPFCKDNATPQTVTFVNDKNGFTGGIFSSTPGLSLNATTGEIIPSTSTPGTYTVKYTTPKTNACLQISVNTSVTITALPAATISYDGSPYCTSLIVPQAVTFTGISGANTGGTYTVSPAGLTINASTGAITPSTSTAGIYEVTYTMEAAGGCSATTALASVTITTAPTATISYAGSPFCSSSSSQAVTVNGTGANTPGKFTSDPGLSINLNTGVINPSASTAGPHTVYYTITASGGCTSAPVKTDIEITAKPSAVAGPDFGTCASTGGINITDVSTTALNYGTITWTTSGTGSFTNVNSLTQATYNPSAADITAGSVVLTLTATGINNCANAVSSKTLSINANPLQVYISPNTGNFCVGTIQPLTSTKTSTTGTITRTVTPNLAIPDANANGIYTTLSLAAIPTGAIVDSIQVKVKITHARTKDLYINLKAPNGKVLNLANRIGDGADLNIPVFSSASNKPIQSFGTNPFNGYFAPMAQPFVPGAAALNNVPPAFPKYTQFGPMTFSDLYSQIGGDWYVSVRDGTTGITGTLNTVTINVFYSIPASPVPLTWSPATDLYSDAAGTVPYAGELLSTVYTKLSTPGNVAIKGTATNALGCTTSLDANLVVKSLPTVSISADYCTNPGRVILTAISPDATSYNWSDSGKTTQSITIDIANNYFVSVTNPDGCVATAVSAVAQELVVNGDFTQGKFGFDTEYYYQADVAGNSELEDDKHPVNNGYGVGTDAHNYHSNFWGVDHTNNQTGNRNFMLLNGHGDTYTIWKQTVNVLPQTDYYFSAWAMSINNVGPYARLQFRVNGVNVGKIDTLTAGPSNATQSQANNYWTRFYSQPTWYSGNVEGPIEIEIVNLENALGGNDFGIDDISFATLSPFVTPPSDGSDNQAICEGQPLAPIKYLVGSGSTGPDLVITPAAPEVTALWDGRTFTVTGTPLAAGTYQYTVTTGGSCPNPKAASGKFVVNPKASINLISNNNIQERCVNSNIAQINYSFGGGATNVTFDGLPAGINGTYDPIAKTASISGSTATAGNYPFTITTTGTCAQKGLDGVLTISDASIGGSVEQPTICLGDNGSVKLSGKLGSILKWQVSNDLITYTDLPANNTINQTFPAATGSTFFRAVIQNGSCPTAYSDGGKLRIRNLWEGEFTNDWGNNLNWSAGIAPDKNFCASTVTIPKVIPGYIDPVLTSVKPVMNLDIRAGGDLTISGGTLQVGGTITNLGVLDATAGTLEFNGPSQTTNGSIFKGNTIQNVIVSSTGASTLNVTGTSADTLKITGTLSFGNSNAKLNSGDHITLVSSATATANVGIVGANNSVDGKFTVERYNSPVKAWRFLAVNTQPGQLIHDAWQEGEGTNVTNGIKRRGISIPGEMGNYAVLGFDVKSSAPAMKWYDPNTDKYVGITSTNIPFDPTKGGYLTFIRGDRSANAGNSPVTPTTLRTTGKIFTGTMPNISVQPGKFVPVNNPYAASIDLRKIIQSSPNKQTIFFYVYDPRLGVGSAYGYGAFQTLTWNSLTSNYEATPGQGSYNAPYNSNPNFIQSGEAFWVSSPTVTEALPLDENKKAVGITGGMMFRMQGADDAGSYAQLRTSLFINNADHILVDGTLQQITTEYVNEVDGMDAKKMLNAAENLSIKVANKLLVVERRAPYMTQDTVFYNMTGMRAQNYQFQFDAQGLSAFGTEGWVEDTYAHTKTPLNLEGATTVDFSVTNVAGTYAANRFHIVFKAAAGPLPVTIVSIKATQKDADIAVEWKVDNQSNMKAYQVEKSLDGSRFNTVGTITANTNNASVYNFLDKNTPAGYNYYRIRSISKDEKETVTQIVRVLIQRGKPEITIHPNPITNGVINLHLINEPAGMYGIRLLNPLGQTIVSKQVSHAEGTSTEKIDWNYNLAHGVYQLEVTRPDASVKVIKVMY